MLYGLTGIIKNGLVISLLIYFLFFPTSFGVHLAEINAGAISRMFH